MSTEIIATTTTTKQRSALVGLSPETEIGTQLPLAPAGMGEASRPQRRLQCRRTPPIRPADDLSDLYRVRLASRHAPATVKAYCWSLSNMLVLAEELQGHPVCLADFITDQGLLGQVCATARRPGGGPPISAWTAAQRRSVLRTLAVTLAPELKDLGIHDPAAHVNRAIQAVAERVGGGYRLPVGALRRRGSRPPSPEEWSQICAALQSTPGWTGDRNSLFFGILAPTGTRGGALLGLQGQDLHVVRDGTVRLLLHDKASGGQVEVTLPESHVVRFRRYFDGFNSCFAGRGRPRLEFGAPGPVWRSDSGGNWSYNAMRTTLRGACVQAEVSEEYTPHTLRAFFATEATQVVSRRIAALAGNWRGTERMDDHYVAVHGERLTAKLAVLGARSPSRAPMVSHDRPLPVRHAAVGA